VVVLVVAADDGVMPQTREAIAHAKAANVPIVVAVNKMDKPDANPERVRRQLAESGLVAEEWGGDTLYVEVSAHTGAGVDKLLETLALQAEVLELKANPNKPASGVVVEAELDRGRGPVATILIQDGTLNRGDVILAGGAHGKVRAMHDALGNQLESAGPSTPVVVIGLADVPSAGDPVHVLNDMKKAQEIADSRKTKVRRSLAPGTGARATTLEDLAKAMAENEQAELKLIIKADVQGSVEALRQSLEKLSNEEVRVRVIHGAVGAVSENDVMLAGASGAIIVGFNVRPDPLAQAAEEQAGVDMRMYRIIYDCLEEIEAAMKGMLAPKTREVLHGRAEVRQVYRIPGVGRVAGCYVLDGKVYAGSADGLLLLDGEKLTPVAELAKPISRLVEARHARAQAEHLAREVGGIADSHRLGDRGREARAPDADREEHDRDEDAEHGKKSHAEGFRCDAQATHSRARSSAPSNRGLLRPARRAGHALGR
jgi:translation initiation factor IF-2